MSQTAPWPVDLEDLVNTVSYKEGWNFSLQNMDRDRIDGKVVGRGLTLVIDAYVVNSVDTSWYDAGGPMTVHHYFIVPAATYDRETWARWLLDRIIQVESHEACEFFKIGETRPFAPNHSDGRDPYTIFAYASDALRDSRSGVRVG